MEVFTKGNQKGNYGYGVNSWGNTMDALNEAQKAVVHEYSNGK